MTIIADDVRGGSEGNPFSFSDIPDAIIAKDWDAVYEESASGTQLEFSFILSIGNGSTTTWLVDTKKQIAFNLDLAAGSYYMRVRTNGHFRTGVLNDATEKTTTQGVSFFFKATTNDIYLLRDWVSGDIDIFSSTFALISSATSGRIYAQGGDLKVYNSEFLGGVHFYSSFGDYYNLNFHGGTYSLLYCSGTFNRIFSWEIGTAPIAFYSSIASTVTNLKARKYTNVFRAVSITTDKYIVNADVPSWTANWSGTSTHVVYRQYEFDLTVTDKDAAPIEEASVTLKDKDGNTVFSTSTDVNGQITIQTVSRGYYNQANGNTLQEYSPHTLIIEKAGYQTYSKVFTLAEKTKWAIKLTKTVDIIFVDGKPALNLSETDPENELYTQVG